MGVTLDVPMGMKIRFGTWGSPDQSMAGQWLVLPNTVHKIHFSLCEVINRHSVFLWANKKTCQISSRFVVFWCPGFQKKINLSHRIKKWNASRAFIKLI